MTRNQSLAHNPGTRNALVIVAQPSADEAPHLRRLAALGLQDFETPADCARRQAEMIGCMESAGYDPKPLRKLAECAAGVCPLDLCTEGCHFATRDRRITGIMSGLAIFEDHAGPLCNVCVVHPIWEQPAGKLAETNIPAAIQWNRRRFSAVPGNDLVAIGTYEVSLNRELDGETYWAGEIHQVVAGASAADLKRAFSIERRYRDCRPGDKLLYVIPVENLARRVAYAQKRFVEERRAYVTVATGRQTRRHLPLKSNHSVEHEAWLLSLPIGARTVAYGCGRRGAKFFERSKPESCPGA